MQPSKISNLLMRSMLTVIFIVFSGCQKDTFEHETESLHSNDKQRITAGDNIQEVIITKDLSTLFITGDGANKGCPEATSGEGFPINGCKDFTVGVSLAGWVYLETTVTVCCACAICGSQMMKGQEHNNEIEDFKTVEIRESSVVVFRDYEISIANGHYKVNERGEILDLSYKVVVNK